MISRAVRLLLTMLGLGVVAPVARAQIPETPQWLTVFLDCRASGCDRDFLITELPFVLWTQDRLDAEVHALVTDLRNGGGGNELTIELLGQRRFAGRVDTITASILPNSSDDMARRELARVLKLGLAPFVLRTASGRRLSLTYDPPADSATARPALAADPWNNWVYRIGGRGNVGAESQSSNFSINGSLSAARITEQWKVLLGVDYDYHAREFNPEGLPSLKFLNRQAEFESGAVRAITDHWSVGAIARAGLDEFRNQQFTAGLEAAAEWNYFPWREATSRQLVAIFAVGARHFQYFERTIYDRDSETRPVAIVKVATEVQRPWGSVFGALEHTRYLHDASAYSVGLFAFANFRLSRGLSANFGGSASKVNDQLFLAAGGLTPEEIYTQQRALRTAFRVNFSAGLSYTFGSILNTIVNPRFDHYD